MAGLVPAIPIGRALRIGITGTGPALPLPTPDVVANVTGMHAMWQEAQTTQIPQCPLIMRALTPDAGEIVFHGADGSVDIRSARDASLRDLRTRIQMVYQDPFSSLSPRMTVQNILLEPLEKVVRLE